MSSDAPTVLQTILQRKHQEVAEAEASLSRSELAARAEDLPPCRGFTESLQAAVTMGRCGVIAEIKKASPSKGVIRENFDPASIARSYEQAGASCLSVLTDRDFFQGANDFLQLAREQVSIPALRKDFMVNDYHIVQSRVLGADCILLIMAVFDSDQQLGDLYHLAMELGMDVLIEVHDQAELQRALALKPPMVGINNRDLRNFNTDLQTTIDLLPHIPEDCLVVTESGIHSQADVQRMQDSCVNCFLVGEAFMRAEDPGQGLQKLFPSFR